MNFHVYNQMVFFTIDLAKVFPGKWQPCNMESIRAHVLYAHH